MVTTMTASRIMAAAMVVPALIMLSACGVPAQTTLPDGSYAYRIDCGNASGGLNYCFEKAGKSCGAAGYSIVSRDGQLISSSTAAESERQVRVEAYQSNAKSILIKCGSS